MRMVRDDPLSPDEGFAELYADLPDATDLWPWLELAGDAKPPVLYLGIGTGRLAVPLHAAGIDIVGVDSHPGMLRRLRLRLPNTELVESRIEPLQLERRFGLVIAPSNILYLVERLRAAARHLDDDGLLAIELANPHWLRSGAGDGVRVTAFDGNAARLEVDYSLADGSSVTQRAEVALVWPEEIENWLAVGAGLQLRRMFGRPEAQLVSSPSFYVVAGR
jgi:trans-aconitate methyltransferase